MEDLDEIEPVKIQFKTKNDEEKGFYSLMISGTPVHGLPNHIYIVNKSQCKMLKQKGIAFEKAASRRNTTTTSV
jgi:hypothetical protein